jgi:hypothetical protein
VTTDEEEDERRAELAEYLDSDEHFATLRANAYVDAVKNGDRLPL